MWVKLKMPFQLSDRARKCLLWVTLFLYFFGLDMFGQNMRKVAIVIGMIYILCHIDKLRKILKHTGTKHLYLFFFLGLLWSSGLIYRSIFYIRNSSSTYLSSLDLFYLFIQVFIMAFFVVICCKNMSEFGKAVVSMMIMQSIIAFLSIFCSPVKKILGVYYSFTGYNNIYFYLENSTTGVGIGLVASTGSIIMLTSQILIVYLRLARVIGQNRFIVSYLTIMLGEVFIGRTGLYLSIVLLLFFFLSERPVVSKYLLIIKIFMLVAVGICGFLLVIRSVYPSLYTRWIERIFEAWFGMIKKGSSVTLETIKKMTYPKLTWETLWGTSVIGGISYAGTEFHNDVGYFQTYFGLGLFGAIAYYLGYLILFMYPVIRHRTFLKRFFVFAVLVMYIAEFKEPVMHQATFPFMILTIELFDILYCAERRKERLNIDTGMSSVG